MDASSSRTQYTRSVDELGAEITSLAGHLNAGEYHWLTLVAEFDTRKGWADGACRSCAHWLNFSCGMSLGTGREKVRVAHALESLPKISAAMARGGLSYSKVRALTRAAEPATEDYFLMLALHGTAVHTERLVQGVRRAKEAEELSREARQHAGRSVTWSHDEDGSLLIRARLPAEIGALFLKALDAAVEEIPSGEILSACVPEGTCGTFLSVERGQPLGIERGKSLGLARGDRLVAERLQDSGRADACGPAGGCPGYPG
jgi:hypothetical protein